MKSTMDPKIPSTWTAPEWHPDFGDASDELEKLREIGLAILEKIPQISVHLEYLEEGYMSVEIIRNKAIIGEVNVVDANSGNTRYGVFIDTRDEDDESYFPDVDSVIIHLTRILSAGSASSECEEK